jgi:hypothetical protein
MASGDTPRDYPKTSSHAGPTLPGRRAPGPSPAAGARRRRSTAPPARRRAAKAAELTARRPWSWSPGALELEPWSWALELGPGAGELLHPWPQFPSRPVHHAGPQLVALGAVPSLCRLKRCHHLSPELMSHRDISPPLSRPVSV